MLVLGSEQVPGIFLILETHLRLSMLSILYYTAAWCARPGVRNRL